MTLAALGVVTASATDAMWSGSAPAERTTFQWMENVYGDLNLMSLATNRFLRIEPAVGVTSADEPGPDPNLSDGVCLEFSVVEP